VTTTPGSRGANTGGRAQNAGYGRGFSVSVAVVVSSDELFDGADEFGWASRVGDLGLKHLAFSPLTESGSSPYQAGTRRPETTHGSVSMQWAYSMFGGTSDSRARPGGAASSISGLWRWKV